MKLITLLRNIFNDNKNNERKLSDKRFNVIINTFAADLKNNDIIVINI